MRAERVARCECLAHQRTHATNNQTNKYLLEVGKVRGQKVDRDRVELNELEVLVVKLAAGRALGAKRLGAGDLGANAGAAPPLVRFPHPVVPVTLGPPAANLQPKRPRHHPAQAGEEVGAEEAGRVRDKALLAVVVPGRSTEQGRVASEHAQGGGKVIEKVGRQL